MWPDVDAQKIDRTLCPDIPPLPTPGLAMALWSVYHTSSFSEAVERCVNLLGDADSTGSMAGQMAGAIYGFSGIDAPLVRQLEDWDDGDTFLRGALLYCMGVSSSPR
mmetsp:Transcript_30151/g.87829  ORF Transcript_30151/g.87829 Transcript_30151/m.87829 type:complete len:107 (+) Transcript_30151:1824-2144(+)